MWWRGSRAKQDPSSSSLKMMQIFIHKVIQTCIHQTVYAGFSFALNVVKCFHCNKDTQTGRSGANETLKLINPRSHCFLYKRGTRIMSAPGFTRTFLKLCFAAPAVFITNYTHIISGMFHTPHSLHQSSEALFKWQVTLQTATGNTHWHVSACYMHSCCVSRNQSG